MAEYTWRLDNLTFRDGAGLTGWFTTNDQAVVVNYYFLSTPGTDLSGHEYTVENSDIGVNDPAGETPGFSIYDENENVLQLAFEEPVSADDADGMVQVYRDLSVEYDGASGDYRLVQRGRVDHALCYLQGTRILTMRGQLPIEELREGDLVATRFGGLRPIRWIGRQYLRGDAAQGEEAVCFLPGALGEGLPRRALRVTQGHSMLVGDVLVLARSLVNGVTIRLEEPRPEWSYIQLEFDGHDCVLAEGIWSESFADAGMMRARFDNSASFHARFPGYEAPAEVVLCAPRPMAGPGLDAALRAPVARAAASVPPGPLAGEVEVVAGPCLVTGWARDAAHPEMPVLLEIVLDGAVLGTVLACQRRDDLERSGIGHAAFRFTADRVLSRAEMEALTVRRAADGAVLGIAAEGPGLCRSSPGPLTGHLDLVASPCRVEGWALNATHPEVPALLEVVLEGEVIGTALASRYRGDLHEAGIGDGRVAFFFEADRQLTPAQAEALTVRRAGDGAPVSHAGTRREVGGDMPPGRAPRPMQRAA